MPRTLVLSLLLSVLPGPAAAQLGAAEIAEGAWFDPERPGQGLMLDALPGGQVFAAWFTYDAGAPPTAQRWFTAQLRSNGSVASGALLRTLGGSLDQAEAAGPVTEPVGTLRLEFLDCRSLLASWTLSEPQGSSSGQFLARPGAELVQPAECTSATKLRWPHAPPGMDDAAYAALEDQLFLMNGFAQHQGGDASRPDDLYLHDGVDLITDNGTPIHALEAGTVRSVATAGNPTVGFTVTVESDTRPGDGWAYVHVVPEVADGARVTAGQRLGTVRFDDAPHLHLSRVRRPAGAPDWSFHRLLTLDPLPWFSLRDDEPPLLAERLRFLRDGSEEAFPAGTPTVVSGAVDIVAGARDPGAPTRGRFPGSNVDVGDRHGVAWIEYAIAGQGHFAYHRAFDFQTLDVGRPEPYIYSMAPWARVIYQPILRVSLDRPDEWQFNFYRLTHGRDATEVALADAAGAWHTDARDESGARRFPDGAYTITVRAGDAAGNVAEAQYEVEVRND